MKVNKNKITPVKKKNKIKYIMINVYLLPRT